MRLLVLDELPALSPICGSGLGSSLLKLPALEDARQAGYEVDLLTSPAKAALLTGAPALAGRFERPEQVDWDVYERVVPLGLPTPAALADHPGLRADPRSPTRFKADYDLIPHVRFWREVLADLLGVPRPVGPARMRCEVPPEAREWARARLPAGPLVTLSLSALTHLKRYLGWIEVAEALQASRPELPVVLVGLEPPRREPPPGTIDLTCQTTLPQLAAVVERSAVVAGTDGLATNLAACLGRPAVALFTVIRPDFVFDPDLALRAPVRPLVHEGCPLQPCYPRLGNYRTAACPLEPALPREAPPVCAGFAAARVAAEVLALLG